MISIERPATKARPFFSSRRKVALVALAVMVGLLGMQAAAAFATVSPPFTGAKDLVTGAPTCDQGFGQVRVSFKTW